MSDLIGSNVDLSMSLFERYLVRYMKRSTFELGLIFSNAQSIFTSVSRVVEEVFSLIRAQTSHLISNALLMSNFSFRW